MTKQHATQPAATHGDTDHTRRRFLLFVPAAVGVGILTTLVSAAVRFLRPPTTSSAATSAANDQWLPVAPVAELTGAQPLARTVRVQHETGWTEVVEDHPVFVLPQDRRVLSAVCPHEGCAVVWRADENGFLCPCHDSRFDAAGARATGPAPRGLDQLPTQIEGDVLKVRLPTQTQAQALVEPNATQVRG